MGILDELMGGGQRQKEFQDFVSRYDQGPPSEGYSDQEVMTRYNDVAHAVSDDDYRTAAQDALARLSPQDRTGLAELLQQRVGQMGVQLPGPSGAQGLGGLDLGALAQVLTGLHKQPGQLRSVLTSQPGQEKGTAGQLASVFSNPVAKAVLAGITAMAVRRVMQRR
ncbi:MAG TPA: hypothetical protein VI007_03365 [bacterium]